MKAGVWGSMKTRRYVPLVVLLALLALVPLFTSNAYYLFEFANVFIFFLLMLSSNVLFGFAGQFSLANVAQFAVAAYTTAIFMAHLHMTFWVAAAAAVALSCLFGVLTALPALRLSAFHLAILSIMVVLVVQELPRDLPYSVAGGFDGIHGFGEIKIGPFVFTPKGQYWFGLLIAAFFVWLSQNLRNSQHGRRFILMADNETSSESVGISTVGTKLLAFFVSSVPVGVAGALFASFSRYVYASTFSFDLVMLTIIALVIGGVGSIAGPAIGAAVIVGLPLLLDRIAEWRSIVMGVVLLVFMWVLPNGITEAFGRLSKRWGARNPELALASVDPAVGNEDIATAGSALVNEGVALYGPAAANEDKEETTDHHLWGVSSQALVQANNVTKSFGGLMAINEVGFEIMPGLCYGILGPNGSGKTTLLNLINGYLHTNSGTLTVLGENVSKRDTAHSVARRGVGRTFQTPIVSLRMSVLDNVMIGYGMFCRANVAESVLTLPRSRREESNARSRAMHALGQVGLAEKAHQPAASLTHAELRMMELARVMMLEPKLALLDEPASGLDIDQMDKLLHAVRMIRKEGTTVIVVEHNVSLVARMADTLMVLDYGQIIAIGSPKNVLADPKVKEVYMGTKEGKNRTS